MKIAKIIITEQPIPYSKNGSWTQRIEYFLKSEENVIDYFICGATFENEFNSSTQFLRVKQYKNRWIQRYFPNYRYHNYIKKLHQISNDHDYLIICVIDNIKLKNALNNFIEKSSNRNKVKLIFYSCGFSYFLENGQHKNFIKNIDDFIFLTESAYQFNKKRYEEFTPEVSVLNNPINKDIFFPISIENKETLKAKYNLKGKTVFLWLSHDRDKKGLNIILNAWKEWNIDSKSTALLVVGAKRDEKIKGVYFVGQVESNLVHEYYKLGDIYLFSTLCKEGFGLSLAEAICSGCFSIVANNGGVSDFFNNTYGIAIESPNIVSNWVNNMEKGYLEINAGWSNNFSGDKILDYETWSKKFAQIFNKWEQRIN